MEDSRIGEVLNGMWRLEKVIAVGARSTVYFAVRISVVDQCAAVKILHALYQPACPDELAVVGRLNHQNIALCKDAGITPDGHRYLVMDYACGPTVTDYADQQGLSVPDRLRCFLTVCEAAEYLHSQFIVHLDLRPCNLLVNGDGTVKLIDFGQARRLDWKSEAGSPPGRPGPYTSPERAAASDSAAYAADIYSLGAVLYELLSGQPPFDPTLPGEELERQIREELPRRPSKTILLPKLQPIGSCQYRKLEPKTIARMRGGCRLPEARALLTGGLDRICLLALRKDPFNRFPSVEKLLADVQRVLDGRRPATARSTTPLFWILHRLQQTPLAVHAVLFALFVWWGSDMPRGFWAAANLDNHNTQIAEDAIATGVRELREDLLPKLTADAHLRAAFSRVVQVEKDEEPIPPDRTRWDLIKHWMTRSWKYNPPE